jgi:hypothetical protein
MPDTSFIAAFAEHPITLSILTVGAIIVIFIWKIAPYFKDLISLNKNTEAKMDAIIDSDKEQSAVIAEIKENITLNTRDILRITIYNENVATEDRLVAAKRYFLKGGNGKVASYAHKLIDAHEDMWKVILATSKPEEQDILYAALKAD